MDLKKKTLSTSLWKRFSFSVQFFLILLGVGIFLWILFSFHHPADEKQEEADIQQRNKLFSEYTEKHHCRRLEVWPYVKYYCDNGNWSETDLMRKIAGKYPFPSSR